LPLLFPCFLSRLGLSESPFFSRFSGIWFVIVIDMLPPPSPRRMGLLRATWNRRLSFLRHAFVHNRQVPLFLPGIWHTFRGN
jgi:hypothetical protein